MLKLAVLISGGGSNLKALIDACADPDYPATIVLVASDTDAPGLQYAADADIPYVVVRPGDYPDRTTWGHALQQRITEHGITGRDGLVVSAGFMRILPETFVNAFSPRIINTHPALLPNFPGAHAVRDALAAGATETGATVHVIDAGVDTGPTLRQIRVDIPAGETETQLHERIKTLERPMLVATIRDIAQGTLTLPTPQSTRGDRHERPE